jgi:hypothetical protein
MRPFLRSDHVVGMSLLDRLWNDDKHRAPHITRGVTSQSYFDSFPFVIHPIFNSGALQLGSKICRVWFASDLQPALKPTFAFDVAFDPLGPTRGGYVYPTLVDLHDKIGDIVELIRPFFV